MKRRGAKREDPQPGNVPRARGEYDVIVVGDYCLDLIFTGLPSFPRLGTEVEATGFEMTPGGAYIPAAAMQRLGLRVGWAADFGDDDFSRFILERARAEGLDETLFVHHRRSLRKVTVAVSYPEDRAFIAYYDPEVAFPAAMRALATTAAGAVYLPAIYYGGFLEPALVVVRARRMKLAMDGNSHEDVTLENPAVVKAVQSADLFLPNASEARRLTGRPELGEAVRALADLCPLVVVKDGASGAYASSAGRVTHAPAIAVTPLDTTGAGDCFNAGFVKAWLDGRPLQECLRWGNVVGGLSTLGMGGTGRVVTAAEVERWLEP